MEFEKQYKAEQNSEKNRPIYDAFYRRIHNIWEFQREQDSNLLKIVKHKHTKDIELMEGMKNIEFIENMEVKL